MTEWSEKAIRRLREAFEAARDPATGAAMSAYMRNLFPFLGIKGPARATFQREALAGMPRPSQDDLEALVRSLWSLPEREYQYAACDLLRRHARTLDADSLEFLKGLIQAKSWWDTVDTLASNVVGPVVQRHHGLREEMDRWIRDNDFWVARAAILHQLKFLQATDAVRLYAYCELRAPDTEFFIRKAIGWALRQYSKTNAGSVRAFVAGHEAELSGLSKREALLWLNGGRRANQAHVQG